MLDARSAKLLNGSDAGDTLGGISRVALVALTVAAMIICCLCATACGSSGDAVVVRVGSHQITKATVVHWIAVEAITSHEAEATPANANGLRPVPPDYVDCIAYLLKAYAGRAGQYPKSELKRKCATKYTELKDQILEILITYYWLADEGAQKGVRVTVPEVARYLHHRFGSASKYKKFLELTGETAAEERMLVSRILLGIKLQDLSVQGARDAAGRQRALVGYVTQQLRRWIPRTSCAHGYVVPECKEYRGPTG
jgi:foldase protein PrsA